MTTPAWAVLRVHNIDAHVTFFTERLGWSAGTRPAEELAYILDPDGEAILLAGPEAADVAPFVVERALIKQPGETVRLLHANVDGLAADLARRGVSGATIREAHWGDRELRVRAPDGYLISFVTRAQLSRDDILLLYARAVDDLDTTVVSLVPRDLDQALAPGAWTVRQLVHHIVDGDDIWSMAIKAALAASGCVYHHDWYTPDNACAVTLDYATRAVEPAVVLFRARRTYIVELLSHLPDPWERYVLFTRPGRPEAISFTVEAMVRSQAQHALEHLAEIQEAPHDQRAG